MREVPSVSDAVLKDHESARTLIIPKSPCVGGGGAGGAFFASKLLAFNITLHVLA